MNSGTQEEQEQQEQAPASPRLADDLTASVRGGRVLAACDRAWSVLEGWVRSAGLADDLNPLAQLGRVANLCLLVAVATGILMLLWYKSSVHLAHGSLAALEGRSLGGWTRSAHRYSSDLAMLYLALHALRALCARKFTGPRRLSWATGIFMVGLVWFIGWTGFWLVWDQAAQLVAAASLRFLDTLPVFGEPLSRLLLTDRLVPSLLFFVVFFLHMLLPLLIAVGLAAHLLRMTRVKLLPPRRLSLALLAGLAVACWVAPAPLGPPARMAVQPDVVTADAWYLSLLAVTLRFQGNGVWAVVGLVGLALSSLPWVLARRNVRRPPASPPATAPAAVPAAAPPPRPSQIFQTEVTPRRCHNCTQCVLDCPYDAVRMVPRTDGMRHPFQAWVDPDRCVGCGVCVGSCDSAAMNLVRIDTRAAEHGVLEAVAAARSSGGEAWVALVAEDIDGAPGGLDLPRWERRLPGYVVRGVPTSGWIRPRFVERLLRDGARGVLVVRDARPEAPARDGNRWVADRLAAVREPHFNPERAGSSAWRVHDYNPARPDRLEAEAAALRAGQPGSPPAPRRPLARAMASALVHLLPLAAAIAPSHFQVANPAPPDAHFVLSFRAFGEVEPVEAEVPAEPDNRPVHMRGGSLRKPTRFDVRVRLSVAGKVSERTYRAKGVSRDGPASDIWRVTLPPGEHPVTVEIITGPGQAPLAWSGVSRAVARHSDVLTFEPDQGFRRE